MTIVEQVTAQMKVAMRAKDKPRLQAIRMIRARIIELSKSGKGEFGDAELIKELRTMVKQRRDAAKQYLDGGRQDLADSETAEIAVIESFLPSLADESKTLEWVKAALASSGATEPNDIGRAMGALMKAHKGEVDAGLARKLLLQEMG